MFKKITILMLISAMVLVAPNLSLAKFKRKPTPIRTATLTVTPTVIPTATSILTPVPYIASVNQMSIVAYYPMRETSGTAMLDASGHGINGKYVNSPTLEGNGVHFVGGTNGGYDVFGSYAEVPDNDGFSISTTGELTLIAWVNFDIQDYPGAEENQPEGDYVNFIGKGISAGYQQEYCWRVYNLSNSQRPCWIGPYVYNPCGGEGSGNDIHTNYVMNTWHMIAMTCTMKDIYFYWDGVLARTDTMDHFNVVPKNGSAPFRIGTRDFQSFFTGRMRDVSVHSKALTSDQISALWYAGSKK